MRANKSASDMAMVQSAFLAAEEKKKRIVWVMGVGWGLEKEKKRKKKKKRDESENISRRNCALAQADMGIVSTSVSPSELFSTVRTGS